MSENRHTRAIFSAPLCADELLWYVDRAMFLQIKVRFSLAFYPGNLVFFSWNLAWNSLYTVEKANLLVCRLNSTPIDQNFSSVLLPSEVSL